MHGKSLGLIGAVVLSIFVILIVFSWAAQGQNVQAVEQDSLTPTSTETPSATATATATLTSTATPTFTATSTPTLTATPTPLVRSVQDFAWKSRYALCSLPTTIEFDGETHYYCATREPRDFTGQVTILSDIMSNPFGLADSGGHALGYFYYRSCTGARGRCLAFTWLRKDDPNVGYALPVLWPDQIKGKAVAPILHVREGGDPKVITDWQVLLVDRQSRSIVQVIDKPLAPFKSKSDLVFDPDLGSYQVVDAVGSNYVPTGVRLGLPLTAPVVPVGYAAGFRLYRFFPGDVPRFQAVLDWLKQIAPRWYDFVVAQQPVDISHSPDLTGRNWAGSGGCCINSGSRQAVGRIAFADRPPDPVSANYWYVVTLVHEMAHVRDLRADKFRGIGDELTLCRAVERSAVETDRAFILDVFNSAPDEPTRLMFARFLQARDRTLAEGTFEWSCH